RPLLRQGVGPERGPGEPGIPRADGGADRPYPRALRGGPAPLRPRGQRPALRAAHDLARRQPHPRSHRAGRGRRLPAPPAARPRRQARDRLGRLAVAPAAPAGSPPRGVKDGSLSARVTRQSGTSFYYAFRFLPARKRRAIYALYSFCRVVDDCVDEPGGEREGGLDRWLAEVHRCYAGQPSTRLGHELAEALSLFPIPRQCFEDIVAGCRMDLTTRRYPRFEDLLVYCHRVASAVGLAAIEIFEYVDAATRVYATELGVALQLTNILRDVRIDAGQDRLYLPLEDLARFGVSESEILVGPTG